MEQVGAVFEIAAEAVRLLQEFDGQIKFAALVIDFEEVPGKPSAGRGGQGCGQESEIDLDKGEAARIPRGVQGLNELIERHQLVRQPFKDRSAHSGQRAAKTGIGPQLGSEGQRVAEAADKPFELGQLAAG